MPEKYFKCDPEEYECRGKEGLARLEEIINKGERFLNIGLLKDAIEPMLTFISSGAIAEQVRDAFKAGENDYNKTSRRYKEIRERFSSF